MTASEKNTVVTARVYGTEPLIITQYVRGTPQSILTQSTFVTPLKRGGYVVAWTQGEDRDGSDHGVFARIVSNDGQLLSDEIAVNQITDNKQYLTDVLLLNNGEWMALWDSVNDPLFSTGHAKMRQFNTQGQPVTDEVAVQAPLPDISGSAVGTMLGDGRVVLSMINQSTASLVFPTFATDNADIFLSRHRNQMVNARGGNDIHHYYGLSEDYDVLYPSLDKTTVERIQPQGLTGLDWLFNLEDIRYNFN